MLQDVDKRIKQIKMQGKVSAKEYEAYLQELELDELKEMRHNLEIKLHRSSGAYGGILQVLLGTFILGIACVVYQSIKNILEVYRQSSKEDLILLSNSIKGIVIVGGFCIVLIAIIMFSIANSRSINLVKKCMIEEVITKKKSNREFR